MSEGYGQDTWCTDGIVAGRLARGRTVVAQAYVRRLTTPKGSLRRMARVADEDAPSYGFDVSAYIGAVGYDTAVAALPGFVRAELMKDDRTADLEVYASLQRDPNGLLAIAIDCDALLIDESESFTFTIRATDVTTELLGGSAQ